MAPMQVAVNTVLTCSCKIVFNHQNCLAQLFNVSSRLLAANWLRNKTNYYPFPFYIINAIIIKQLICDQYWQAKVGERALESAFHRKFASLSFIISYVTIQLALLLDFRYCSCKRSCNFLQELALIEVIIVIVVWCSRLIARVNIKPFFVCNLNKIATTTTNLVYCGFLCVCLCWTSIYWIWIYSCLQVSHHHQWMVIRLRVVERVSQFARATLKPRLSLSSLACCSQLQLLRNSRIQWACFTIYLLVRDVRW